jgi:hypothetical protein
MAFDRGGRGWYHSRSLARLAGGVSFALLIVGCPQRATLIPDMTTGASRASVSPD